MNLVVIPARYGSSRLPGKPLVELAGRPMIQHVYERASQAERVDRVVVATDDDRILECVTGFGGEGVMTSPDHPSGSDRIAEAVRLLSPSRGTSPFRAIINMQGDEPMLDPRILDNLIDALERTGVSCATAVCRIDTTRDLFDTNVVKVVVRHDHTPLYFSRSPIPCLRDLPPDEWPSSAPFLRHIGIYAYQPSALQAFVAAPPSSLERIEQLEQLRMLDLGISMICVPIDYAGHAVDTAEDVMRVEALMSTHL